MINFILFMEYLKICIGYDISLVNGMDGGMPGSTDQPRRNVMKAFINKTLALSHQRCSIADCICMQ